MGGLSYYRKRLNDKAKRIQSITSLLKQGVKFVFTPALETIVRERLAEMSTPPIIVYPNWNAVSDNSHTFLLYRDASVDGFGATSTRNKMATPSTTWCSSATLPSSHDVTGPR